MSKQQEISGHGGGEPMRGNSGFVKILPQQECNGHCHTCDKEGCLVLCRCPHCTPQQDTDLEEWAGENPYANGKQQDTWGERFEEGFVYTHQNGEWKTVSGWYSDIKDFIKKEKAISEHQGYQRGLQEALELVGEDGEVPEDYEDMIDRNRLKAELRKKLSERGGGK